MSWFRKFISHTRAHFSTQRLEKDMAEEMRLHLEHLKDQNVTEGMSLEDASYAAKRRFGGIDQVKEQCREGMGWRWVKDILRDTRFAARVLRKHVGFTAAAVLTLALCIGANTTIFSLVYALLLKPLPFPEPNRMVEIHNVFDSRKLDSNLVQYTDYKANAVSYDAVGLWRLKSVTTGDEGAEERITSAFCTAEMLDILGVKPLIGHFFTAENSQFGEHQVVVLTEPFWKSWFNSDSGVLGKTLRVDGETFRIIGVAPRQIEAFDTRMRFIVPMPWKTSWIKPTERYALDTPLYARLKRDVTVSQANTEAAALERRFYNAAPDWNKKILDHASYKITVATVQAERVQSIKASLLLLEGGVVFVLLIGCVNVANLLLTRINGRQDELSIRLALGATRLAVARQLLVENLVLTVAGASLGIGGAFGAIRIINQFSEKMLPGTAPFVIDGRVLGFTIALSIMVVLLIGILPITHLLKSNRKGLVQSSSPTTSPNRSVRTLSAILVTGQVAVTLMLLTGAGLLIHSFANAVAIQPGFKQENLVTARIALGRPYWNERGAVFQQQLIQALKEIPDVSDVAIASGVPYEGGLDSRVLTLRDSPLSPDSVQPKAFEVGISVGYFQALHIRLLEGRFFNEHDADGHEYVVDEHFARSYFPGRSAVGAHFTFMNRNLPAKSEDWPVIVGVVQNIPHNGVEDKSNTPFSYYPILKSQPEEPNLFVRSSRPLGDLVASLREKLHGLDPVIPLYHIESLQTAIDESFNNRRAVMLLLGGFATLALFLSAVGLYGVLAFDITLRTREIGIRGALGASRGIIVGLIMRQGLYRTGIGLIVGLVGASLLSQSMASMLFGLKPTDPWTYVAVCLLLATIATLASYLPARRAAKTDLVQALKME